MHSQKVWSLCIVCFVALSVVSLRNATALNLLSTATPTDSNPGETTARFICVPGDRTVVQPRSFLRPADTLKRASTQNEFLEIAGPFFVSSGQSHSFQLNLSLKDAAVQSPNTFWRTSNVVEFAIDDRVLVNEKCLIQPRSGEVFGGLYIIWSQPRPTNKKMTLRIYNESLGYEYSWIYSLKDLSDVTAYLDGKVLPDVELERAARSQYVDLESNLSYDETLIMQLKIQAQDSALLNFWNTLTAADYHNRGQFIKEYPSVESEVEWWNQRNIPPENNYARAIKGKLYSMSVVETSTSWWTLYVSVRGCGGCG